MTIMAVTLPPNLHEISTEYLTILKTSHFSSFQYEAKNSLNNKPLTNNIQ